MFTDEFLKYADRSVLCWLATASTEGVPNVSPKEIFTTLGSETIVIANIASPQSSQNVKSNPQVCVAFVDILIQKGFQAYGEAVMVNKSDHEFDELAKPLMKMTGGKFPFSSLFKIRVTSIKTIIAPKYKLFPETTEEQQVKDAKKTYGLMDK